MAKGPRDQALSYTGFIINNTRFRTKDTERGRQNSGVLIEADTICRASARDNSHVIGKVSYYGVLRDIIVLDYHMFHIPIFKCDWANIVNGVKVDDGVTLVNLHGGRQFEKDPFILASQAKQVFYWREREESSWYVVLQAPPRGDDELKTFEESDDVPSMQNNVALQTLDVYEDEPFTRVDVEGHIV